MDRSYRLEGTTAAAEAQSCPAVIDLLGPDPRALDAMRRMLAARGLTVKVFERVDSFLAAHDCLAHGCVILDAALAQQEGTNLLQALAKDDCHMPIVVTAKQVDVRAAVRLVREGAFDVLSKPFDAARLLGAVTDALEEDVDLARSRSQRAAHERRLATLTPREREVLTHVMCGRLNKQIAWDLGTAEKTVKVHRARVMVKMQVRTIVELARLVERARPNIGVRAGGPGERIERLA